MTRVTANQRSAVASRAGGVCEYCYSPVAYSSDGFSVEHIIPRSHKGETSLDNLAYSCQRCNNHKYNKVAAYDPLSGELVPLYNPRQHSWKEHFDWSGDLLYLVGLTPTGRATIEALRLNREGVVNLRRALIAQGEHPSKLTT